MKSKDDGTQILLLIKTKLEVLVWGSNELLIELQN